MKIFISKYALTQGIIEIDARIETSNLKSGKMMAIVNHPRQPIQIFYEPDYSLTRAAALARAEEMRTARIASLRKQITKLEKLDIT